MGVDKWINQQLDPDKLTITLLDARLEQFAPCEMNRKIVGNFPAAGGDQSHREANSSMLQIPPGVPCTKRNWSGYQEKKEQKQGRERRSFVRRRIRKSVPMSGR